MWLQGTRSLQHFRDPIKYSSTSFAATVSEDFPNAQRQKRLSCGSPLSAHGSLSSEVLQQPCSYENSTFLDYNIP